MPRVRLGGIKAFEKRAYLTSLCRSGDDALGEVCSRLAAERINISLLTHIADTGTRESLTAASTESAEGFSSYLLWKASYGECSVGKLLTDISTISIFPHDQKLNITGSLLGTLAKNGIRPYGFASSPSAMTILVPAADFEGIIYGLFDAFEFPTYSSPLDWHAAYRGQEELLSEIICSYEEEVIKIYNLNHHVGLDLWKMTLPVGRLGDFGSVLLELHQLQLRMPLLVSKSFPDGERLGFAYCLPAAYRKQVQETLDRCLLGIDVFCQGPVSVFLLHGPHFGDRYGIANAFVSSLRSANIAPLAMSCAVSSVSAAINDQDSKRAIEALSSSFQIPAKKP
jgi:aspartokinase